jgi:4-amino-4-deoxy-L-arabinose transferase-like glycosyltransferase
MPIWAWSFYLLHHCWREEAAWPWFALAAVLALGLYTKYSVALLPLAAFAFFLADPLGRRRLASWRPWAALLLTLLLFLPHLHWLAQHDFLPLDYARARGGETGGFLARLTAPFGFAFNELLDHLGLFLALALARPRADTLRAKASVAFLGGLTLLLACGFGLYHLFGPELRGRAAKSNFPGPEIAAKLDEAWRAELSGEPLLIAGPIWEAGNVALNLPNRPPVLIEGDLRFSPWVKEEDLRRGPFLLVWKEGHRRVALPPVLGGLTPLAEGQVDARYRNAERLDPLRLNYAIFAPERLAEVSSSSGDRAKAGPEN